MLRLYMSDSAKDGLCTNSNIHNSRSSNWQITPAKKCGPSVEAQGNTTPGVLIIAAVLLGNRVVMSPAEPIIELKHTSSHD